MLRAMLSHPTLAEPALVMAYLLDWSLKDTEGQHVTIRGVESTVLASALDALDSDDFDELYAAVKVHAIEMKAEREDAKKKAMTTGAAPISALPSDAAGVSTGSVN